MWDGTVWATGLNYNGQLGDGSIMDRTNPVQVTHADGTGLSGAVEFPREANTSVFEKRWNGMGDGHNSSANWGTVRSQIDQIQYK